MTTTTTTLLLARHGQTVWHAENRYAGVSDIGLTDTGRAQAEALGRWAAAHPVDAIWSRTLAEFEAEVPDRAAAFRADPVAHPFPGAEDPTAAAARGAGALRRIAGAHPGGRVLVVAHNTLLRLVLCTLLSIPAREYRRVFPRLRNAAISELRMNPDGSAALLSLNVPCETDGT
jgi:probable phosphoglycerate mutase